MSFNIRCLYFEKEYIRAPNLKTDNKNDGNNLNYAVQFTFFIVGMLSYVETTEMSMNISKSIKTDIRVYTKRLLFTIRVYSKHAMCTPGDRIVRLHYFALINVPLI